MVKKSKKNRKNSKNSGSTNSGNISNESKKTESTHKKKKVRGKSLRFDIFSEAAMENAYYLCHNVQDLLKSRGFAWPDGEKKKKPRK